MAVNKNILNSLRFHTVDGQYLQDNDVEHLDFVIIDDLKEWFNTNTQAITRRDVLEMAISGGSARRNYCTYEHFIDTDWLLSKLAAPESQIEEGDVTNG